MATNNIQAWVVAPVPWFPFTHSSFGRYGILASIPAIDHRHGIDVWHPRFAVLPGLSTWINPVSMALGAWPTVRRLHEKGDFDIVDAHFVYPDGVAGTLIGAWLGKPVLITARGSDVNLAPRYCIPRKWIRWAAQRCAGFITVSTALRNSLLEIGVPAEKVTVIRNGVDLDLFRLGDRGRLRAKLGMSRPTLLSIGNLVEEKGHDLVIRALVELADTHLIIIGTGPEGQKLRRVAQECGVSERITWIAYLSQAELVNYYAAADVTVLASSREGMANVLLESLACGTPVIATAVGGNPEIVNAPEAGLLVRERTSTALVKAYHQIKLANPNREATRRYAEFFGWHEPITAQVSLLESITEKFKQFR